MSNKGNVNQIEARRLAALELLRTSENSHFIDEARANGASPEDTALNIVKSMVQSDKSAAEVANYIKEIRNRQNAVIHQTIRQKEPYSYIDDSLTIGAHDPVNEIVEEIMRLKKDVVNYK
ncbi:hypothetical protein D3C87_935630 [compost metagenome]